MKKYTRFTLLLGLCLLSFSCSNRELSRDAVVPEKEIKTYPTTGVLHFMYGEIYRSMGNINYANMEYRKALNYDTTTTILNAVGDSYAVLGKEDEARKYYEQSLYLDSLDLSVKEKVGRLYLLNEDYEKALPLLEDIQAASADGPDPALLKIMAETYRNTGDLDKAREKLSILIAANPGIPWSYIYMAEILTIEEDFCHAVPYLEKAVELTGGDDQLYRFLLKTVFTSGDDEKVGDVLFQWVNSAPEELDAYLLLLDYAYQHQDAPRMENVLSLLGDRRGESWEISYYDLLHKIMIGREDLARAVFMEVIAFDEVNRDAYRQMAFFYWKNGDYDMALNIVDLAVARFGQTEVWLSMQVMIHHQAGRLPVAIALMENAARYGTLSLELSGDLAQLYWESGQMDKADSLYSGLLAQNPNNPVLLNNYAYFLSEWGQKLDKALTCIDKALEIDKKMSYYDTKAWIHYRLGEYRTAGKWIKKALAAETTASEELYYHHGMILSALGKKAGARSALNRALEINGDYEPAATALKEL